MLHQDIQNSWFIQILKISVQCVQEGIVEFVILRHAHVQFVALFQFCALFFYCPQCMDICQLFPKDCPSQCRHIFQVICRYLPLLTTIFCCSLTLLSIFQIHDLSKVEVMLELFLFNHIKGKGILKQSFIWENSKHTQKQNCTVKTQVHQLMAIVSFPLDYFEANPRHIQQ